MFFLVHNASRELVQRSEENRRLFASEREQRQLSETLGRVGLALSGVLDLQKLLDLICRESTIVFKSTSAFLWLVEGEELVGFAAHGTGAEKFIHMRTPLDDQHLLGARVLREKRPILINDAPRSDEVKQQLIELFDVKSMLGVPLIKGERALGSLMILDTQDPQRFHLRDLETAPVFGSYAAVAIDNASLYEEAQRHLQHEHSLREIDRAISSSLNLDFTLQIVLKQALNQLHVDASDILLVDQNSQTLFYSAGLGFSEEALKRFRTVTERGIAGQAALERKTTFVPQIMTAEGVSERLEPLISEGFISFASTPLIAKGKALGVLEVFQRASLNPDEDWLEFLETLAGQAAIAIDNAALFFDLQRSNLELAQAYDATIEGWAYALELRDKETEGHTRRVTEMTLRLAKAFGLKEQDLVQIRRGALLHDIGKMAIPDSILLKPDSLSDEEWKVMRQHPQLSYDMLFRISYLTKALDIPYCHHEKWDGTGYPRGLKNEEIPLSARLFAVVDVYDALTSDRPYRKAWSHEKTIEYIREQAGKHFDPQVTELFLKVIRPGYGIMITSAK